MTTTTIIIALGAIAILSTIMWAYWRYQYFELREEVEQLKIEKLSMRMEKARKDCLDKTGEHGYYFENGYINGVITDVDVSTVGGLIGPGAIQHHDYPDERFINKMNLTRNKIN